MDKLNDLLEKLSEKEIKEAQSKISEFMSHLYKSEEDCKDDDCEELNCPECQGQLESVFGTLPLQVECKSCKRKFVLRELLSGVL